MKRAILWLGMVVGLVVVGGAGWRWWTQRSADGGGYRFVAEAMCARFASDAVVHSRQWSPDGKTEAAGRAESQVFTPAVDALVFAARKALESSLAKAKSDGERAALDRHHSLEVLKIVGKSSPDYLALCERLAAVYQKCDGFTKEPERFKHCVSADQQPVVMDIAARLFRLPGGPPR